MKWSICLQSHLLCSSMMTYYFTDYFTSLTWLLFLTCWVADCWYSQGCHDNMDLLCQKQGEICKCFKAVLENFAAPLSVRWESLKGRKMWANTLLQQVQYNGKLYFKQGERCTQEKQLKVLYNKKLHAQIASYKVWMKIGKTESEKKYSWTTVIKISFTWKRLRVKKNCIK